MNDENALLKKLTQECEAEQLHLSGAIQSFGAMLCLEEQSGLVTHASANLAEFIGIAPGDLLGRSLAECNLLPPSALENLPVNPGQTLSVSLHNHMDALLIRGNNCLLLEIERCTITPLPIPLHHYQRPLMYAPRDSNELIEYHHVLLQAFRELTGYERCMAYQFHEDWSGKVIAEVTASGMGSYLGMHFPASDIPAIARNLYLINPARMIPDASAPVIPLLSHNAEPPDLTWSNLRSVSPVHLQYLQNMGVCASFSVPIRIGGTLWGMVACHNQTPLTLSSDQRDTCVALCNAYALGLSSHIASRRLQMLDSLDRRVDKIMEALSKHTDPLDGIESNSRVLMEALAAQGFAMAVKDNVVIAGNGPDLDGIAEIDNWFLNGCRELLYSTDHLSEVTELPAELLASVSGMMAIKARSPRSGWVRFYWFRPAEPQEITWAGNPNKPITENAGAIALSPRRSFERWVETRMDYSRAWSGEDKLVASKFRSSLLRWL